MRNQYASAFIMGLDALSCYQVPAGLIKCDFSFHSYPLHCPLLTANPLRAFDEIRRKHLAVLRRKKTITIDAGPEGRQKDRISMAFWLRRSGHFGRLPLVQCVSHNVFCDKASEVRRYSRHGTINTTVVFWPGIGPTFPFLGAKTCRAPKPKCIGRHAYQRLWSHISAVFTGILPIDIR